MHMMSKYVNTRSHIYLPGFTKTHIAAPSHAFLTKPWKDYPTAMEKHKHIYVYTHTANL